jgi:serine/threonine-protein kinase
VETLGGFQLTARLGKGKTTEAFEGVRVATGAPVCVRLVHPSIVERAAHCEPEFLAQLRVMTRKRVAAKSAHLVTIEELDEVDGIVFVVTELLHGRRMERGARYAWQYVAALLDQMCDACGAMRAVGVPAGIDGAKLYLVPRGTAEIVKLDTFVVTRPENFYGKLGRREHLDYRSPGELMGKPTDERDDVYTLGVLGYELLTGRLPVHTASAAGLLVAMLKNDPPAPSTLADVPRHVDELLLRCLQKDADQRFASCAALRDALRDECD